MTVLLPLLHFSLSMDVSSPDLFGSIHEDFSLTSVSKMPNTESKVCHVKGCGCGNQPESWKMDSVDSVLCSGTTFCCVNICVCVSH